MNAPAAAAPSSGALPKPPTAERSASGETGWFLLGLGAAAVLGAAASRQPAWSLFALYALLGAAVARLAPTAFVVAFVLVEPLENLLLSRLPAQARYFDEAVLLGVAASVLGPLLFSRPRVLLRDPATLLVGAFLGWNVVSAVLNDVPVFIALSGIFVTLDYALLFLTLRAMPISAAAAKVLIKLLLVVGTAGMLVGLLQLAGVEALHFDSGHFIDEGGVLRVPSFFDHPNDFGYFTLLATFVGFGCLAHGRRSPWIIVATLASASGMMLSSSRSAYLGLILGLLAGVVSEGRRLLKIVVPLALVLSFALSGTVLSAIESRIHKVETEGGDARLTYAKQTLPVFLEHPLFGVGPGRYGGEVANRFGSPVHTKYGLSFNQTWRTIDSFWMHLVGESGGGGVVLILGLFAVVALRARRLQRTATDPWVRALLFATPLIVAGEFAMGASTMLIEANFTASIFWLLLGVGASAAGDRLERHPRTPRPA